MRKFALLLLLSLAAITNAQEKIQWMSIEEAYALTLTESDPEENFHRRIYRLVRLVQAHG